MLSEQIKQKCGIAVAADLTLTDTTFVSTGLAVPLSLGGLYHVAIGLRVDGGTDGIRFTIGFSGVHSSECLTFQYDGGQIAAAVATAVTVNAISGGSADFIVSGVVKAESSGILSVTARKNTDVGADTTVKQGSYLAVRQLT